MKLWNIIWKEAVGTITHLARELVVLAEELEKSAERD